MNGPRLLRCFCIGLWVLSFRPLHGTCRVHKGNFPKSSHIFTIRRHHFVAFYHQKVSVQGEFFQSIWLKTKKNGEIFGSYLGFFF